MTPPPRSQQQRKQDALNRLERDTDAWVATADAGGGTPYLVPLSFLWDGSSLLIATPSASPTSRNLQATTTSASTPIGSKPGAKPTNSRAASSCAAAAGSSLTERLMLTRFSWPERRYRSARRAIRT